jgi:hypothetical protein
MKEFLRVEESSSALNITGRSPRHLSESSGETHKCYRRLTGRASSQSTSIVPTTSFVNREMICRHFACWHVKWSFVPALRKLPPTLDSPRLSIIVLRTLPQSVYINLGIIKLIFKIAEKYSGKELFFRILNRSVDIHYDIFILIQYLSN